MDPISRTPRTDLHVESTTARSTPKKGDDFRTMLSRSAAGIVQGAQSAVTQMPGGAVLAAAVRGAGGPTHPGMPLSTPSHGALGAPSGANPLTPPAPAAGGAATNAPAEGPGAVGSTPQAGGSVENMLQNSADMNLYYLQLQEAMSSENRVYSAQSNVLKARHDTVKNAIGNIR